MIDLSPYFNVFTLPFIVHTDASERAIGGVLSQVQEGEERVIVYWSQQLNKAEHYYSTVEREALAVGAAVKVVLPLPVWLPLYPCD